jgi:PKD repeat protein
MKSYNMLITIIVMLCLINVVSATASVALTTTWGSDGGKHPSITGQIGQTTGVVTPSNKVSGHVVTAAGDVTFTSTPTTGTCMDNSKKVAVYMPAMTNPVYSESTLTYVNVPVTFDPLTTSMLFEYNPVYLGDSNIASQLTKSNYDLLIVPMSQMSTSAASSISNYIANGGSVWFLNDPCMTPTGTSSIQLTSQLGNGVSASIGSSSTITVVNTDNITSGLPTSFKPVGSTAKTAVFRSLSGSGVISGLNYQVLMSSGSTALLVKFENPTTGARVIYSNPNMFISGGTSSYFTAQTATQLFTQTKAWIMKFAQNPNGLGITFPGNDKQLTVTVDDEQALSDDVAITPMINAETSLGITPSAVNTFYIIPSSTMTKDKLEYYAGYGDTHTLHSHLTTWDTSSLSAATYKSDISADKAIINTVAGLADYGFTSWRFPMTTYCANSMQAVSDSGFIIESSNGDGTDGSLAGNAQDNSVFFPKQLLVNNLKTNLVELEIPAGFDIDYATGTAYYNAYNAYTNQFKGVNFPANFVIAGHYQGIGTNCGVAGWNVNSTALTSGLTSILTAEKAANPVYSNFYTLSNYLNGTKSAQITATYDGSATTVTVVNIKPITGFTIKAGVGTVRSATCDGVSVTVKTDNLTGASYITKDLTAGTHTFVISNSNVVTPVASFTASKTSGTTPLDVTFNSTSINATNLSWNFGDGSAAVTGSPVSHTFTNTGTSALTYTVTLTATSISGATNTSSTQITVNPAPPVASFTVSPTSGTTAKAFTFTDTSTNYPTGRIWNFGDGGSASGQSVKHVFTTAGTYNVILTAENTGGSSTATQSVTVSAPAKPVASFAFSPNSVKQGDTITFTSTSTNLPTTLKWTFSDNGATASTPTVTHVFNKAGSFKVSLIAANSVGNNVVTNSVVVSSPDEKPAASFTVSPTSGTTATNFTFTDTSTNSPTGWTWNFGDGGTGSGQNVSHTFTTEGTYNVTLTVGNTAGNSTATESVVVSSPGEKPAASFTVSPTSGTTTTTFTFTDTSANSPTGWAWNFGDGGTGSGQSVIHKFTTAGTYNITLTAENTAGNSTATKSVTVSAPARPVASFTYSPTSVKQGDTVTFTNTSTNSPTMLRWMFSDDGTIASTPTATHVFSKAGSFKVTLVAANVVGNSVATKTITVT